MRASRWTARWASRASSSTKAEFRSIILDVTRLLKGGNLLADSLAVHPGHFPDLYTNMVRAGEASGSLAQIFERLAEFEKRRRDELCGYIIGSLIYPALLSFVGLWPILVLLNFVVLQFAQIFSDPRMKIPTSTLLMLKTSELLNAYGLWVAGILIAAIVGLRVYINTPEGRDWGGWLPPETSSLGRRLAQSRNGPLRPSHGNSSQLQRPVGAGSRNLQGHPE